MGLRSCIAAAEDPAMRVLLRKVLIVLTVAQLGGVAAVAKVVDATPDSPISPTLIATATSQAATRSAITATTSSAPLQAPVTTTTTALTRPAPTAAVASARTRLALGVNVHSLWASAATYGAEYSVYGGAGATWIRTDVYWDGFEPARKGVLDEAYLRRLDAVVDAAARNGQRQLLTVLGTPAWARPAGSTRMSAPLLAQDFSDAMATLAARYRGRGVAFELWNEPNEVRFLSTADPASYAQLACAGFRGVRRADAGATVVAGAVSGEDVKWLERAYDAGLGGCFDVLSIHPYRSPARGSGNAVAAGWEPRTSAQAVFQLMQRRGDGLKPMWFTEFGWAADSRPGAPVYTRSVSPAEQATLTTRFLRLVETELPFVPVVMVYEGKDTVTTESAEAHFPQAGPRGPSAVLPPGLRGLAWTTTPPGSDRCCPATTLGGHRPRPGTSG